MTIKEQRIDHIHKQLDELLAGLEAFAQQGKRLDEVECGLVNSLLSLGLSLLRYYIHLVGELLGAPQGADGCAMAHKGQVNRCYVSVFGRLTIRRPRYYAAGSGNVYPLDARLGLGEGSFSYLLCEWLGLGAVETDFEQAAGQLDKILGLGLRGMQARRATYTLAGEVEAFYRQASPPAQPGSTHLCAGFDGKGVPVRGQQADAPALRLSKGRSRGVSREATVSLGSEFSARPRTREEILSALFRPAGGRADSPQQQWHAGKHLRAVLSDKREAVRYGLRRLLERDTGEAMPLVVLTDGDRGLEKAVREVVQELGLTERLEAHVLDLIHVLEYVWTVANAHLGEKNPGRQAWVEGQLRLLLESRTEQLLEGWQAIRGQKGLSRCQAYNLERAITYVKNHVHMMDYKRYLAKGFPITTGAVESACGHFVKSRMQRNAMHWDEKGAQQMLNIRAVRKNGDWEAYNSFFIQKQQQNLYARAA